MKYHYVEKYRSGFAFLARLLVSLRKLEDTLHLL